MQIYLLVSWSNLKVLGFIAAIPLQVPSQWMQQSSPCLRLDCTQSPFTALPCTPAFLAIACGSSSANPGCEHSLILEFQFRMVEADGEPALHYQRWLPRCSQERGIEHSPGMSGWVRLAQTGPLSEQAAIGSSAWDLVRKGNLSVMSKVCFAGEKDGDTLSPVGKT